jgi:ectoine hydroxylase-related dioxygenase (phytanoyl-CoA dioxygenase family)
MIVHHPKLLAAVRTALGTQHIALWSSDLNIKQPNSKSYFSEHQDATYTGLQPANKCLTVWVALSDPVGVQEGCLSFLKCSHRHGQLPHVEEVETLGADSSNGNMLSRGQRVMYDKKGSDEWISLPLSAGDATLHSFYTIHKSGHNLHPTQPRVGLALRYMAQTVRQTGTVRELVTWVDNEDDTAQERVKRKNEFGKYFDLEPLLPTNPSQEDVDKGRMIHREAMQRENNNYFQQSAGIKGYAK